MKILGNGLLKDTFLETKLYCKRLSEKELTLMFQVYCIYH